MIAPESSLQISRACRQAGVKDQRGNKVAVVQGGHTTTNSNIAQLELESQE